MPDTQPIRTPQAGQETEAPPRRQRSPADPCALVIFGASGDLTKPDPYEKIRTQLEIDNWRRASAPFNIRAGRHMPQRATEFASCLKLAPYAGFRDTPVDAMRPNGLVPRIAPDEGISPEFEVKCRGPVADLTAVEMDFHDNDWFPKEPNVGYETLLRDVMIGDPTLFMRADRVEQVRRVVQPVLNAWAAEKTGAPVYQSGTDGPEVADELLARDDDRVWRPIGRPPEQKQ